MGHLTVYPGNIAGNLTKIFQKSQMPRGVPGGGGMGGFGIDRYIKSLIKSPIFRNCCSHREHKKVSSSSGVQVSYPEDGSNAEMSDSSSDKLAPKKANSIYRKSSPGALI